MRNRIGRNRTGHSYCLVPGSPPIRATLATTLATTVPQLTAMPKMVARVGGAAAVVESAQWDMREFMAIFGVGAFYDGTTDVTDAFLAGGVACVGWAEQDAPALHKLLARIRGGDIVYIKAHPPGRDLIVKAVGIVTGDSIANHGNLGQGVPVRWI